MVAGAAPPRLDRPAAPALEAGGGSGARTPGKRERLRGGSPLRGLVQTIASARLTAMLLASGADFIILDREHGEADEGVHARSIGLIARSPALSAVRVHPDDVASARRYRRLGVDIVLMPDVRSPATAARLVEACTAGPQPRASPIAMIESRMGAAEVAAIAATPGLEGVVIGPNDLSRDLGRPADFGTPDFVAAVGRIEAHVRAAGLVLGSGIYPGFPADRLLQAGHTFLVAGSDAGALGPALDALIGAAASAGGE